MEDLSYFIEHWNTDMVAVGAVICLILLVSGYFYGKIIQQYVEPLKKIDCTFLGIFFIFAVFQICTFYFVAQETSTEIALMIVALLILISPLLCLLTWSNPLPNWANLFTLVIGLGTVYVLGKTSAGLNTNNIFFDSIHYLSAALESSVQKVFAHINFYNGIYHYNIDQFHDFEGFAYFWGIMLKWTGKLTDLKESLTPVYIWGSSFVYWMALGSLISSSVSVLFKKWWKIIGFAAVILFIAPYYSNYWNTTLAFFGNSLRTIIIGFSVLIAYQFAETMDGRLFIPQTICTYAALFCSSSGFFIEAFITIGMLFVMLWQDERKLSNYILMILSTVPFFHYAVLILTQYYRYYWLALPWYAIPVVVLLIIAVLFRNHLDLFNKIFKWLLPIAFIGLAAVSFLKRNGEFPYSFYFAQRSNMDMCNNFTGFYEDRDFLRNIILYVMLAFLLVRPKVEGKFKFFLLTVALLFLNPLVQPAVSTYMTSAVYSRSFDIIVNPFTLAFLAANVCETFKTEKYVWTGLLSIIPLAAAAYFSYNLAMTNIEVPYTNNLIFKEDGFDWETKVAPDSWDLYNWIDYNIDRTSKKKPVFLSQDIGLKGYVANIELAFSSSDYRDALANEELFEKHRKMLGILYPEKRYREDEINGEAGDYNDLPEVLITYDPDYLIIRNTIALWDERGWYNKSYLFVNNSGQASVIYENDTWALLKVNHDWTPETTEEETAEEETNG